MCGRYNLIADAKAIFDFFDVVSTSVKLESLTPRYNIAPSQHVPAVIQGTKGRELVLLQWGLIPSWSKEPKTTYSTINARAETVDTKPLYRSAFKKRRCIIPATGFFEWQSTTSGKQPYNIYINNQELFAMAGLWEHWEGDNGQVVDSCSIIVTTADKKIEKIHNRMPVILDIKDYDRWLDPHNEDVEQLKELLIPHSGMILQAINKRVNSPKYDDPSCITKVVVQSSKD